MIVELNISNFAIMENISINFTDGFNILTGETGTGKSIIVEGLNMILGDRASIDMVKTGCEKATIEGLFYIENRVDIEEKLKEFGIEPEESGYLLITRDIYSSGRSVSRINGRTTTLSMLNQITKKLVDIHSQHEHQSLLNINNHIRLIDNFARRELEDILKEIKLKYNLLVDKKNELKKIDLDPIERDRNLYLYMYQLKEMTEIKLEDYDEEGVFNDYNKLSNIKTIELSVLSIVDRLSSDSYKNESTLDDLREITSQLDDIKKYDTDLDRFSKEVKDIYYSLYELTNDLKNYSIGINLDEEYYKTLEDKIEFIEGLKRKYGNTLDEVIDYREEIKVKIDFLKKNEENIEKIKSDIIDIEDDLKKLSKKASKIRKEASLVLTDNILKELKDLNMDNVNFKIEFSSKKDFSETGLDNIEFLISTNLGEKLKPLSKVVSGGEMSRIMLAFKSVFANYDNIQTLIFDEIDTGISGHTAQLVGFKIQNLAKNHQVICISHLPQIASLADSHFLIDKKTVKDETLSYVKKLDYEDRVLEISRLLGGVNLTEATKIHAREMLDLRKIK